MNTVRFKMQMLINHEPISHPAITPVTMIPNYYEQFHFMDHTPARNDYLAKLHMLGEYWDDWYLIRMSLLDTIGSFIGETTAPVYTKETDHPTALFHFYLPRAKREGIPDRPPMTFTVSMMVPRNENRVRDE